MCAFFEQGAPCGLSWNQYPSMHISPSPSPPQTQLIPSEVTIEEELVDYWVKIRIGYNYSPLLEGRRIQISYFYNEQLWGTMHRPNSSSTICHHLLAMAALLESLVVTDTLPLKADLLQLIYPVLWEIDIGFLSVLYFSVRSSQVVAPFSQLWIPCIPLSNLAVPKLLFECF